MLKRGQMRREKKGMSTVVATILLIMITIFAVLIVWGVYRTVIKSGTSTVGTEQFTTALEIDKSSVKVYAGSGDVPAFVNLKVTRGTGEGNLNAIKFVLSGSGTDSVITQYASLQQGEGKTFSVPLTGDQSIEGIEKIRVIPLIINEQGKEQTGIQDEYKFTRSEAGVDLKMIPGYPGATCAAGDGCTASPTQCPSGYDTDCVCIALEGTPCSQSLCQGEITQSATGLCCIGTCLGGGEEEEATPTYLVDEAGATCAADGKCKSGCVPDDTDCTSKRCGDFGGKACTSSQICDGGLFIKTSTSDKCCVLGGVCRTPSQTYTINEPTATCAQDNMCRTGCSPNDPDCLTHYCVQYQGTICGIGQECYGGAMMASSDSSRCCVLGGTCIIPGEGCDSDSSSSCGKCISQATCNAEEGCWWKETTCVSSTCDAGDGCKLLCAPLDQDCAAIGCSPGVANRCLLGGCQSVQCFGVDAACIGGSFEYSSNNPTTPLCCVGTTTPSCKTAVAKTWESQAEFATGAYNTNAFWDASAGGIKSASFADDFNDGSRSTLWKLLNFEWYGWGGNPFKPTSVVTTETGGELQVATIQPSSVIDVSGGYQTDFTITDDSYVYLDLYPLVNSPGYSYLHYYFGMGGLYVYDAASDSVSGGHWASAGAAAYYGNAYVEMATNSSNAWLAAYIGTMTQFNTYSKTSPLKLRLFLDKQNGYWIFYASKYEASAWSNWGSYSITASGGVKIRLGTVESGNSASARPMSKTIGFDNFRVVGPISYSGAPYSQLGKWTGTFDAGKIVSWIKGECPVCGGIDLRYSIDGGTTWKTDITQLAPSQTIKVEANFDAYTDYAKQIRVWYTE